MNPPDKVMDDIIELKYIVGRLKTKHWISEETNTMFWICINRAYREIQEVIE